MPDLRDDQVERYARHIILDAVGGTGQEKLLGSRVLVVGAGGLGSPVAMYLAAAGVGTIGIVDDDVVDLTNLQRQVLHGTSDVGRPKVVSAAETIAEMNPDVTVVQIGERLSVANALDLVRAYDLVVDGSDNFATRYLLNDACWLERKPLVSGAIFQFEGQVAVFDRTHEGTPCYRCIFPTPPAPGAVPNCQQAGVLGVLAGVVGTMQANEAIKLLLRLGEPIVGRLLLYDALEARVTSVRVARDAACRLCGDNADITSLVDYEEFCGVRAQ